jgi:hypothetical protein
MKDYEDVQKHEYSDPNEKTMGYILVIFMIGIVLFMVFAIFASWHNPKTQAYIPPPGKTLFPADEISPTPDEIPQPQKSSEIKPEKPVLKDEPASPVPKKEETPQEKPVREEIFRGEPPDGAPNLDRVHGDMFTGKTGRASIFVKSQSVAWEGARYYLIDNLSKTYRSIRFDKLENEQDYYKLEVPPGNYTLKFVKTGYFTFEEQIYIQDRMEIEIIEPLEKRPSLDIKSDPSGAKVYFDKKLAGATPTVVKNLDARKYDIEVVKDGYETEKFSITFQRDRDETKNVKLYRTY